MHVAAGVSRLDGQVAIVTGAATGIGLAIASRLRADGARIVVVDMDGPSAERAVTDLGETDSVAVAGDAGEPAVADRAVATALKRWGRADVLVNNAGIIGETANTWELSVEGMDRAYRTNLRSVFLFCRAAIPPMLESGYGRIVNIASIAGKEGNAKAASYSSTKAGVIGLTKSVGKELARTGIRVNCVAPAMVNSGMMLAQPQDQRDGLIGRIPMGRPGEVEEVAATVAWLASAECSYTTGAVFDLSGGRATY